MVNVINNFSNIFKIEKPAGKYNDVLARVIAVYVAVVLSCYMLYMIAPVITFIAKSFLYSFQTYLGLVGAFLVLCDIFITRCVFKGRFWYLLVAICVIAGIAALKMREYGVKDNIFDLVLVTIQMTLVYSFSTTTNPGVVKRVFKWWYGVAMLIWVTACSVSIFQFIFQIGYKYIADPNTDNPELTRQGFLQSRLFGLFTGLDYAVYISLFLVLMSLYYLTKVEKIYQKVLLVLAIVILFSHIVLSGSRSVMASIAVCSFFIPFFLYRNKEILVGKKRYFKRVLLSLLVSLIVFAGIGVARVTLAQLPNVARVALPGVSFSHASKLVNEGDILAREELEESKFSSNNRFEIWESYARLYKEYGIFGLSLSNYNDYIAAKHSDSYLVKYFSDIDKGSQKTDLVYESHNNYIFILVGTGYLGLICFFSFFVASVVRVVKNVWSKRPLPKYYILCLAIVASGFVQAMFMNGVFLKINAVSFLFWAAFGVMNNQNSLVKNKFD